MDDIVFKILGYGSEVLIILSGFISSFFIFKKNRKYLANKLISFTFFFIAIYGCAFLAYDLIAKEMVIQVTYRLGLIFLLVSISLLFLGVKVLVHSQFWIKKSRIVPLIIVFVVAYSIWISFSDFIEVVSLTPVVNTKINLMQMIVLILAVYLLMGNALHNLIKYGLHRLEGKPRERMRIFVIGFVLTLVSAIISTISQIVSGIDVYFDIAYFVVLALSMVIMTAGLVGKPEKIQA